MANPCDQIKKDMTTLDGQIVKLSTALNNATTQQEKADIQKSLDAASAELDGLAQDFAANGCGQIPQPAPKQNINILMVADGKHTHWASFGPGDPNDDYFGLSEVIRTLSVPSNYPVNFTVTKAHRDKDPGQFQLLSPEEQALFTPEFPENFKFNEHDLSVYDEIWLFGVGDSQNGETEPISQEELQSIHEFMEGGGGVFATGDHQELGAPLCGKVPRVSSMRKWFVKGVDPRFIAPDGLNANRIDTLRSNPSDPQVSRVVPVFNFDNQSDDIPQQIFPTPYPIFDNNNTIIYFIVHPLLDHPDGFVDVLPDHMHEGEIINPGDIDLGRQLQFTGEAFDEYPSDLKGKRLRPFLVATGQTFAHTTKMTESHGTDPNSPENPRSFGIIGAYDGRLTGRGTGRVVVDSTWHHFFDINLIGDPLAPAPKNQGFKASGNGLVALDKIKRYYRNIGLWLARAPLQGNGFAYAAYHLARSQPLSMIIEKNRAYSSQELLQIGFLARSAFNSFAPAPTQMDWLHAHLRSQDLDGFRPTPWESSSTSQTDVAKNQIQLLEAALGGAVLSVARDFKPWGPLGLRRVNSQLREVVQAGISRGFAALAEQWSFRAQAIAGFAADVQRMIQPCP
jgi:hypothetical protein